MYVEVFIHAKFRDFLYPLEKIGRLADSCPLNYAEDFLRR